ncbi:MAG: methyltransferase domain-containing protein [Planctomycetes bacterium]|nr:methyltransferase domain-containing protein [Planctomycetota bacterium]
MSSSVTLEDARGALRARLREYYGRRLKSTSDLSEGACCPTAPDARFREVVQLLPDEVVARRYGCACPIPEDDLTGLTCLDLGSGAGFDAFLLASRVGPTGLVHGVDMTAEQLEVARRAAPEVAERLGFPRSNVEFHEDFIETADVIDDGSIDLVISDCVVNLSPAKDEVCRTMFRVLREGGEVYLADVVADRRVPPELASDPVLVAECLGGALYEHDWLDALRDAGFLDPRVVSRRLLRTEARGVPIVFWSVVVRAFKLSRPPLDRRCEDYGQLAVYRGGLPSSPARYTFDDHHVFEARRPTPVCRNTARMLSETRLSALFEVTPPVAHFGLFRCGPAPTATGAGPASAAPCC